MQVTLTLGTAAMEYVTGIPEEELPGILSDVLERSLRQQVKPVPSVSELMTQAENDKLLIRLKELIDLAGRATDTSKESPGKTGYAFDTHREVAVSKVSMSNPPESDTSDEELLDLFRHMIK